MSAFLELLFQWGRRRHCHAQNELGTEQAPGGWETQGHMITTCWGAMPNCSRYLMAAPSRALLKLRCFHLLMSPLSSPASNGPSVAVSVPPVRLRGSPSLAPLSPAPKSAGGLAVSWIAMACCLVCLELDSDMGILKLPPPSVPSVPRIGLGLPISTLKLMVI